MSPDVTLVRDWRNAISDPAIAAELEGVYAYIAAAVESRGPACWASGRCCNFERTGHRLYVTGLETAYALRGATLTDDSLAGAVANGTGPFQVGNLCGIHTIKPLGCRVYFCDRSAQRWQEELSESMLLKLRSLHDRPQIEYRYGEWRGMLRMFLDEASTPQP